MLVSGQPLSSGNGWWQILFVILFKIMFQQRKQMKIKKDIGKWILWILIFAEKIVRFALNLDVMNVLAYINYYLFKTNFV